MRAGSLGRACAALLLAATVGAAQAAPMVGLLYEAVRGPVRFFVFGSTHIGYSGFYPWNPAISAALEEATAVYPEALQTPEMRRGMWELLALPEGQRLADTIPPALHRRLHAAMTGRLGVPARVVRDLEAMRPYFLVIYLGVLAQRPLPGIAGVRSLDEALADVARRREIEVRELEGVRGFAPTLSAWRPEVEARLLERAVERVECEPCARGSDAEIVRGVEFIVSGEADAMAELDRAAQGGDALLLEAHEALVDARNARMVARMESEAASRPGPLLFAPGAAHLGGPKGILQLLRGRGYTLRHLR